ncbi:hypothetical protein PG991_011880 [Apiospora marii]|uniref:Peptidase metallopeptidase domain-containing protein n=1 Tax=Apiospora marii TaxID=335849 RepID=A0ABR1RFF9_9PEZI
MGVNNADFGADNGKVTVKYSSALPNAQMVTASKEKATSSSVERELKLAVSGPCKTLVKTSTKPTRPTEGSTVGSSTGPPKGTAKRPATKAVKTSAKPLLEAPTTGSTTKASTKAPVKTNTTSSSKATTAASTKATTTATTTTSTTATAKPLPKLATKPTVKNTTKAPVKAYTKVPAKATATETTATSTKAPTKTITKTSTKAPTKIPTKDANVYVDSSYESRYGDSTANYLQLDGSTLKNQRSSGSGYEDMSENSRRIHEWRLSTAASSRIYPTFPRKQAQDGARYEEDKRWPSSQRQLAVRFLNGSLEDKKLVKTVVNNSYNTIPMHIRFKFLGSAETGSSEIRVLFADSGDSEGRNGRTNSQVDSDKHTMRLVLNQQDPEYAEFCVLHQFGNALGLRNEHQYPDSGILFDHEALRRKGCSDKDIKHHWQPRGIDRRRTVPYDERSIMHYGIDKDDTLNLTRSLRRNQGLSNGDKKQLTDMYPAPAESKAKSIEAKVPGNPVVQQNVRTANPVIASKPNKARTPPPAQAARALAPVSGNGGWDYTCDNPRCGRTHKLECKVQHFERRVRKSWRWF